jgi:uncharacterized protein YjbI with pentapeptide repeats
MIITQSILIDFEACDEQLEIFNFEFPDGLDISPLWNKSRTKFIESMLASPFIRRNIGWAMLVGMVPKIEIDVYSINLSGLDINSTYLSYCNMNSCDVTNSKWSWSILEYVDFSFSDMSHSQFRSAKLFGCFFTGCSCRNIDMYSAYLEDVSFVGADLSGANLHNAIMRNIQFDETTIWPTGFDVSRIQV